VIVNSRRHLAHLLGYPLDWLQEIALHAEELYDPFTDYSGKRPRLIERPVKVLRDLQRRIYQVLLRNGQSSRFAHAGVPGQSISKAVRPHTNRPLVVTADIRDFYPSIKDRIVFHLWRKLRCGNDVASLLTRLTTYRHHLPQGASTSMALANLALDQFDRRLFALLRRQFPDLRYGRWVDDMVFSGSIQPDIIYQTAAAELRKIGFRIHHGRRKRRVMPAGARQEILGLVVNQHPTISRRRRRLIRAIAHRYQKHGGDLASVKGHIQYLRTFHSGIADQLQDSIRLASVLFANARVSRPRRRPTSGPKERCPPLPS